jgi:hypothetical protein
MQPGIDRRLIRTCLSPTPSLATTATSYSFIPIALCTRIACRILLLSARISQVYVIEQTDLKSNMISSDPPGILYARTYNILVARSNLARPSTSTYIPIQPLDLCALAPLTIRQPPKHLRRLLRTKAKRLRRLSFETRDGAAQLEHRFGVVHGFSLVDDVFEPGVGCFDLAGHVGESVGGGGGQFLMVV